MAATNVQAFPGDVTISSNLAVGTVTATNLIRGVAEEAVRWNSQNETVFPQSATTQYHKIATLGTTGNGSNGGKIRIYGTIGGFGTSDTTLIDAFVGSRGSVSYGGTLNGYGGDPTGVVDIVVYLESNGTFGVWLKLLRYFTFDFTLLGAQVSNNSRSLAVLPCPTTNTSVAAPTGTLQGSVVSACSVVFTGDGNVGIGTTNPQQALEVHGNILLGKNDVQSFIHGGADTALSSDNVVLIVSDANDTSGVGAADIIFGAGSAIDMNGTRDFTFAQAYPSTVPRLEHMRILGSNGYVGIGTLTPTGQLEVHGAGQTATSTFNQAGLMGGVLALRDDGSSPGNGGAIMFGAHQGFFAAIKGDLNDGSNNSKGNLHFYIRANHGDATMTNVMTILDNGNVGIGTIAPLGLLHLSSGTSGDANLIIEADTDNNNEADNPKITFRQDGGYLEAEIGLSNNHMVFRSKMSASTNSGFIWYANVVSATYISKTDLESLESTQVEQMRLTGAGNLGIGTDGPSGILDLYRNTTNGATMKFTSSGGYSSTIGQKSSSTADRSMQFTSNGYAGSNAAFKFLTAGASSGYTDALTITGDGLVGIGTDAPTAKLHIKASGTNNPSVNGLYVYNDTSGVGDAIISARVLGTGGDPYLSLDVGGVLGWSFGIDSSDSNKLKWNPYWNSLTTATKMTLDTSGALGLGTDAPDYHLTIKGAAKIHDSLLAHIYIGQGDGGWGMLTDNSTTWNQNLNWYGRTAASGNPFQRLVLFENDNANQTDTGVVGSFTGQHRCFMENVTDETAITYEGLIVSANRDRYINLNGPALETGLNAIRVSESIPLVSISQIPKDKTCFGVISSVEDPETREERSGRVVSSFTKECGDTRIFVNSLGEGAIWVTNMNGNLESGDYITTSTVAGYGQKQDTEFLANYTVAKITMGCNFNPATQPVKQLKKELGDVKYWVKTVYESVSKEEYSNLTEENRTTTTETVYTNGEGEITTERYNTLETTVQSTYSELSRIIYQKVSKETSTNEQNGWELEISQEMVNILNEYGQIQWEDHATETEKAYKIRYLDANGVITDEANTVHTAAFVGCTYHCG